MHSVYKNGQGSIILRAKLFDSTSTVAAGKQGLTFSTSLLQICTMADNEASGVVYSAAGSTIETISTLGTYAAPTATKCRFKELSATYHPGVFEFQFADARYAVAGAKSLLVSVNGPSGMCEQDFLITLPVDDPFTAKLTVRDMLQIEEGAALAVTINTVDLRSAFTGSIPNGAQIWLESGTGKWQMSSSVNWDVANKRVTVDPPFGTLPVLAVNYRIFSASGAPTTDAIDADLTDAAVTKIWARDTLGAFSAGSAAKILSVLSAGADPWGVAIAGYVTPGTFGYIFASYIDAAITSRLATSGYTVPPTAVLNRQEMDSNSTKLTTLITNVAAIKAKTDAMTFTFAGVLDVNTVKIAGVTVLGIGTSGNKWRGS